MDQLFRQLTPETVELDAYTGSVGYLTSTVQAQWRVAIENGYRPPRQSLSILRGMICLNESVQAVNPGSDAVLEGLKDYRLSRLLGDVQPMFEPMHWIGHLDKLITLMASSPRIIDDAIAAAVPDRAAEERRASSSRGQRRRGPSWVVPTLASLFAISLSFGRGPPASGVVREEWFGAILFLLVGGWLLRQIGGPHQ
jgi:hypothetical protein